MKMAKNKLRANFLAFISILFIFSVFLMPHFVDAQSLWKNQVGMDTKSGEVGDAYGQGGVGMDNVSDVRVVVGNYIRIFLGFMGIIFLCLTIYGGFTWMTAGGDESKISQARKTIVAGVIGLIVVVASFAIAAFVTNAVFMATK